MGETRAPCPPLDNATAFGDCANEAVHLAEVSLVATVAALYGVAVCCALLAIWECRVR